MSFDIHLVTLSSKRSHAQRNQSIRAALGLWHATEPDEFGCVGVPLGDGSDTELFISKEESEDPSLMLAARGFGARYTQLIWDLAQAGELGVIAGSEPRIVLTRPEDRENLQEGMEELEVVVVENPTELLKVMSGDFGDWESFRNKVVRR